MVLNTRRRFLEFISALPFFGMCSLLSRQTPIKPYLGGEFVLVRGWVLRKSDFSEAPQNDY
jgi:hypothetical protein